jgi:hypothetical protein
MLSKILDGINPTDSVNMAATKSLENHEAMLSLIRQFNASLLFIGHGSKGQFGNIDEVLSKVDILVAKLNSLYGIKGWLAIFGGDNYNSEKPDIAHIIKHLKDKYGVAILAIQSDVVIKYGGVDQHVDFVRYVPTFYKTMVDSEGVAKKVTHWGGLSDGVPQGPTAVYLGEDLTGGDNPLLKGVIAIGGGPIGLEEAKLALEKSVPVRYIQAVTKFPEINGIFGSLDDWAIKNGLLITP